MALNLSTQKICVINTIMKAHNDNIRYDMALIMRENRHQFGEALQAYWADTTEF
jgi:hypothetical protein